ncbi:sensor histidine kinase [Telluribacter sp. SYSU D00476]|uniref:sensor histidine kinase n=1 Tax=Telluribacter sp. SYSU D00476 TaxID=2811430 RepID=UPI001FF5292E|nr:histidine kinase [Telluribacter sp. SYSU D00476]
MNLTFDKGRFQMYLGFGGLFLLLLLSDQLINNPHTFVPRAWNNLWHCTYVTVLNFILFEYTLPFFRLHWKRILAGLFLLGVHLMLYSFGLYAWRQLGILFHIYTLRNPSQSFDDALEDQMAYSAGSIFFFGISQHIYGYYKLRQAAQQLRIEKQQAELNFLKSQTNPHFLFNTLNNIYSLSRDKSDRAPESILRLSKILRFMLYETSGAYIAIEQELKIISDYIALEQLRYDESLRVNFRYDVEDQRQALPPLLLIPLVENAFKHGVSETPDEPYVDIYLTVKQRQLDFVVKNSSEAAPDERGVKENIGLSNLRRQLEILYTDYRLSVVQGTDDFTATLHINLSSHV